MRTSLLSASVMVLASIATANAHSQSTAEDPLVECIGIEDNAERLACFDRVVRAQRARAEAERANSSAQPAGTPPTAAQSSEEETETRRFGLPRPSLPSFFNRDRNRGDNAEQSNRDDPYFVGPETQILERSDDGDVTSVMMTVTDVTVFGYGTQRFEMTNGQVWEVTGGDSIRLPRSARNAETFRVEIRRAMFGGYMLRLEDRGSSVRVRRVDD